MLGLQKQLLCMRAPVRTHTHTCTHTLTHTTRTHTNTHTHLRGLAAGIYTTNSSEAIFYIADNCKANVMVVENEVQLLKILEVR